MKEVRERIVESIRRNQQSEFRQSLIAQKVERARHYVETVKRLERNHKLAR